MWSKAPAPNKHERARMGEAKMSDVPDATCCMACLVWFRKGNIEREQVARVSDYNHTKSGNIRRGHIKGYAGCLWHHRGRVEDGWSHKTMRGIYGPSLMDGGKLFSAAYGTDDELIALQDDVLENGW